MTAVLLQAAARQVLNAPEPKHFRTAAVDALELDLGGIPGGRHHGFIRPAGPRERWYGKGTPMRSGRQLSLVSVEELAEIARRLGIAGVEPGWLGANVLIQGVADFTLLPWGTRLIFSSGAVLVNEGDNAPCRIAGREVAAHHPGKPEIEMAFARVAGDLRGLVASVEVAGIIAAGPVTLKLPPQRKRWDSS